jgi:multiple sugar transport system substrate-binding protein
MIQQYEDQTGVKITLKTFPFDGLLTQEANAAQSGSNAFDLYQINEAWVGQFYDNKWLQPLTDVDHAFTWDPGLISFEGVGQWDSSTRSTSPSGTPYALPINGNIQEFMYRTDLYSKLNLSVPTTWDQVVSNAKAAQSAGVVENGYVARGKTPTYDFSAVLFSNGGNWYADDRHNNWTPTADTPAFRTALEQFKALADVGPKAPQTIAQAEATSLMQGGSVLQSMLVTAVSAPLENASASRVAGKIGYAETPGKTPVSGTWVAGIPAGLPADRAQAAYNFLTWLTGHDAMQTWADLGGVTTRTDITSTRPDLKVIIDSAKDVRAGMRYTFTSALLKVTDPAIGEYLAGTATLDQTVSTIQAGLHQVASDAGFGS